MPNAAYDAAKILTLSRLISMFGYRLAYSRTLIHIGACLLTPSLICAYGVMLMELCLWSYAYLIFCWFTYDIFCLWMFADLQVDCMLILMCYFCQLLYSDLHVCCYANLYALRLTCTFMHTCTCTDLHVRCGPLSFSFYVNLMAMCPCNILLDVLTCIYV